MKLLHNYKRYRLSISAVTTTVVYCTIASVTLISCNKVPVASFTVEPDTCAVLQPVDFDASDSYDPDGEIVEYSWRFDDGESGDGPVLTHVYEYSGEYHVSLEVTDNKGKKASSEQPVYVIPPDPMLSVPDTASIIMYPDSVGYLAVADAEGTLIELILPPGAVSQETPIRLIALENNITESMDRKITGGIRLEPGGLELDIPATILISFRNPVDLPGQVRIFRVSPADNFEIVPWQTVSDTVITGRLYHFSEYQAGTPNDSKLSGLVDNSPVDAVFDDINEFENTIGSMGELADLLEQVGRTADARSLEEGIANLAERVGNDILNEAVPENPCGKYLHDYLRYAKLIGTNLQSGDLITDLRGRGETILNHCPLHGEILFNLYSIPEGFEGGLDTPLDLLKNATSALGGGGRSGYYIRGPGFYVEEGRFRIYAVGDTDNSIDGEVEILPPFEVKLNVSLTMHTVEMLVKIMVFFEGTEYTLLSAHCDEQSVEGELLSPFGILKFSTGSSRDDTRNLVFNYVNGDQYIEEYPMDELGLMRFIWTLNLISD